MNCVHASVEIAYSNPQNRCVPMGFCPSKPHLCGYRRRPTSTWRGASTSTAAGCIFRCIFASHGWDPFHGQGQLQHAWQKMEKLALNQRHLTVKAPPQLYFNELRVIYIYTSSTAQGGGGSFKKRKTIGEIGCWESRMSKQKHWPTD